MFQFSRLPSRPLCIQDRIARHYPDRIPPFGYPRINTSVQLPWTYRRLRVLHRHLVPRHSSYTLLSLNFTRSFIECSMHISLNHYSIFKELCRRPHHHLRSAARGNDTSRVGGCQGSVRISQGIYGVSRPDQLWPVPLKWALLVEHAVFCAGVSWDAWT